MYSDNTTSPRIEIVQGASKNFYIWFTDNNNQPLDLTDYSGALFAKALKAKSSDPIDVSIALEILDASSGAGMFEFSPSDTSIAAKDYIYQIELRNEAGSIVLITSGDRLSILERVNS
jgi:hypothetical protein